MRASTSGHAILIRDEGNTDPSHDGKMLAKPRYKNPAQVLSLDEHETYPTPPAPEGSRSPFKHYPTPKVYAKVVTLIYPAETGKEGWQCNTQANRRGAGARAARKAAGCYTARLRTMSLAIPSCTSTAPPGVPRFRASPRACLVFTFSRVEYWVTFRDSPHQP